MRRAIDQEFEAINEEINQAQVELANQLNLLEQSIAETFRQLRMRLNGEEVRPGKQS